jgi:hypothetical protein
MWIFTTDGFLSIVDKDCGSDQLLVRGRVKGDIERAFPGASVTVTPEDDYRFRAVITRKALTVYLHRQIKNLTYPNFKDTVTEPARHHAYLRVWDAMLRLQQKVGG